MTGPSATPRPVLDPLPSVAAGFVTGVVAVAVLTGLAVLVGRVMRRA